MTWAIATGIAIGAVVGGGSAALQKKDILQGALMGGAVGGISGGIGSLGTTTAATVGESALASGATDAVGSGVLSSTTSPIASGIQGLAPQSAMAGEGLNFAGASNLDFMNGAQGLVAPQSLAPGLPATPPGMGGWGGSGIGPSVASQPVFPNMAPAGTAIVNAPTPTSTGFDAFKSYLGENKGTIGLSALAGGMAPNANQPQGPDMGTIRPYTYSAGLNPGYTGTGTPYFNQRYTAGTPYAAAEGGIMHLAGGGSAVSDYNKMLMDRAQQEYVNSPPLGAFRSHFNDPIANAGSTNDLYQQYLKRPADPTGIAANQYASPTEITRNILSSPEYLNANPGAVAPPALTGPLAFDPVSRRYVGTAAPAAAATPNAPVESNANNNFTGGAANGGLMGYAMGGGIGGYYPEPDDGQRQQSGMMGAHQSVSMGPSYPMQGIKSEYASGGGIGDLGSYSDGGRLLRGPGDGVSDDIPAEIGGRQPARLADGEFVVPARIVSELGNGSTDAGAKQLYAMMNRVQANRRKTVGDGNVAVNSRSSKYLPA